ncbi:Pycsar system effector family protein [Streptomyces sp. NPDC090106]|uniref:Pycsar system effector family protein n=1 Tax=Streptomyces sp. NPDC090106 TaxID=3365946 RepID=UPI00380F1889
MTHPDSSAVGPAAHEGLTQARADVIAEIARTDTKAGALLAAFGLPLAVLVGTLPGRHLDPIAAILVGLGAVGLVAAILVVLASVRPARAGRPRGSYLHWAACTAEEVIADVTVDQRAERIVTLSKVAERKYAALRLAIDITSASIVLLVLALLVGMS